MLRVALSVAALASFVASASRPGDLLDALPSAQGAVQGSRSNHWAVIVAGSSGYSNYRHQADAAHAYQRLLGSGIPAEQIITFIDGGIANDSYNPVPGKVFNKPDPNGPGQDVWAGLKLSYNGSAVTAENLYAVLRGNASGVSGGSGEVLRSNSSSHVMLAYFDHGATGILGMPVGPYVYADDLNATFAAMADAGLYAKLTVYVEACESGSMFDKVLSDRGNVYATTASNPHESSWGTYCYPDDTVTVNNAPVHLNTCLGDLYSISWLENADAIAAAKIRETLEQQYVLVRNRTFMSHVMQYGSKDFVGDSIWAFEGGGSGGNGSFSDSGSLMRGGIGRTGGLGRTVPASGAYLAGARSRRALAALTTVQTASFPESASTEGNHAAGAVGAARRAAKRAARMGKFGRRQAVFHSRTDADAAVAEVQAAIFTAGASAAPASSWDARTASLQSLWLRYAHASATGDAARSDALYAELSEELRRNARFHDAFEAVSQREFGQTLEQALRTETMVTQWSCYKTVNNAMAGGAACGPYTDVALQYARLVSRLCDVKGGDAAATLATLQRSCASASPLTQTGGHRDGVASAA